MSRSRLLRGLILAGSMGLVAAQLGGDARRLSLDAGLAVTAGWLSWLVVSALLGRVPVRPDRLRWRPGGGRPPPDRRPRSLVASEGLVAASVDDDRTMRRRLRPKLAELADNLLMSRHGIDPADRRRVATVLGSTAWLADAGAEPDRRPALAEIERFLDLLLGDEARDGGTAGTAGSAGAARPSPDRVG